MNFTIDTTEKTEIDQDRVAIQIKAGELHETATKAEAALVAAGVPFYTRGGQIVRPIIESVPSFHGCKTKVSRVKTVNVDALRDYLSRAVRFEKLDKHGKKPIAIDPPYEIAHTILARDGQWLFPSLTGLITTPTLRPDGSVLATPGYDPTTGLLLLAPPPMPAISERPSRTEALAALDVLDALLDDFPFVADADRSATLSTLMTPVLRGGMQVAPLHTATSPEARTGKSYIFDLMAAIATGDKAPVIAAAQDENETEKRLDAALLKGQPIIAIDNLNGDLGGTRLCQAVERPLLQLRILGFTENRDIINTVCVFGNGNNMRLIGDITPRTVQVSLDAKMERPELRNFNGDPFATILADRGRYIAAILTIARAYLAAGCPELRPLASFAEWTKLVRCPLIWLGRTDPWETNEKVRSDDPTRNELRAVMAAWRDLVGLNIEMTAGDLKDHALSSIPGNTDLKFHKAITAVAPMRGRPNEVDALRFGRWLSRNKDRVVNFIEAEYKISGSVDGHTKQMKWCLKKVD
jgi:putative DNA primase/helicase